MRPSNCPHRGIVLSAVLAVLFAAHSASAQQGRAPLGVTGRYVPDGMLIQGVTPGSSAERAGLQRGDIITQIEGVRIQNDDDLAAILSSSAGSVFVVIRKTSG